MEAKMGRIGVIKIANIGDGTDEVMTCEDGTFRFMRGKRTRTDDGKEVFEQYKVTQSCARYDASPEEIALFEGIWNVQDDQTG